MSNTLVICQRTWWDKYYGNTYFTARAIFDDESYMVPFQYGSSDDTLVRAAMEAYYTINGTLPWGLTIVTDPEASLPYIFPGSYDLRRNPDITIIIDTCEVQRRKDLHGRGRMKTYPVHP